MQRDHFIAPALPPIGDITVAALLVLEDSHYLMQLRDNKPHSIIPATGVFLGAPWSRGGGTGKRRP